MKTKLFFCVAFFCFCQTYVVAQQRISINGTFYNDYDVVYIGCTTSFSAYVQVFNGTSWQATFLDNYGPYSTPSGWTPTFQPGTYTKTSVDLSSSYPSNSGQLVLPWSSPGYGGTAHITIRTTPQIYFTSTPTISGSYSSNTYSVYAGTSGNVNWTGYGGVQINGSGYYSSTNQSATISTQLYGGLLEVTASNGCGTSSAISYVVGTPFIQNTTINGSNGSTATVSYVAGLSLDTRGTATGANWNVTNGTGSISAYGTSCNAYPSNFLRVVSTATNSNGSGQDWTFYIFKEGYSGYRMAYPNPARDQVTLEFDDVQIAEDLLNSISLVDEKGKLWKDFDAKTAKSQNYFQQNKGITFNVKEIPKGIYYMQIKLAEKLYRERIIIE